MRKNGYLTKEEEKHYKDLIRRYYRGDDLSALRCIASMLILVSVYTLVMSPAIIAAIFFPQLITPFVLFLSFPAMLASFHFSGNL